MATSGNGAGPTTSIAHQAFQIAAQRFAANLNKDKKTSELLQNATSMEDVKKLIEESQKKYEDEKRFAKARKWIAQATATIHHYSGVIDVFAQVDPLHVSVVWGSLKLVVLAAQSHDKTIALLSKALSKIARALPRVELATLLYTTQEMKSALEDLYTNIFKFFSRAHKWYREGWVRHIWHSFTQPPALQYEDILEDIDECSRHIDKLAQLGSHIEINRKLTEVQATEAKILAIYSDLTAKSDLHFTELLTRVTMLSSALINTDQRVTDLQFSAVSSFLEETALGDGMEALQYNRSLVDQSSQSLSRGFTNRFWLSPKLDEWTMAKESRVIFIQGNSQAQSVVRKFLVLVIDQLQESQVPILWALPSPEGDSTSRKLSPVDILKHLVVQGMKLCKQTPNESSMARLCTQFRTLTTEREWVRMLASVLKILGPQCYLVIDLSILDGGLPFVEKGFSWIQAFQELFEELSRGSSLTIQVKVLLLTYSSKQGREMSDSMPTDLLVPVRKHPVPQRMHKKMEAQVANRNRVRIPHPLSSRRR